jgi:hypothetical protein
MPELSLGQQPRSSALPAVLIAIGVLAAIAAAIFFLNPRKTAEITLRSAHAYAQDTKLSAISGGVHIVGSVGSTEHDLYVAVDVDIADKLRLPLFLKEETITLTAPDGSVLNATALTPAETAAVVTAFPALQTLTDAPALPRDAQVAPGTSLAGRVIFHFPQTTEEQWRAKKSATMTVALFHQDPQTVTIP